MDVSVPCLEKSGDVGKRKVDTAAFRRRGRRVLLKEYVIMAEARRRVGTHAALSRSEVSGSMSKMYRQKGTGNARHGSRKANQLRGGGVAFAKKPRNYGWSMPRQARRAALEAALRGKLEDGEIALVESFDAFTTPRTRDFVDLCGKLGIEGSRLVVPAAHRDALWRSCRNVPGTGYRVAADLNAYDLLRHGTLVIEEAALTLLRERFGHGE